MCLLCGNCFNVNSIICKFSRESKSSFTASSPTHFVNWINYFIGPLALLFVITRFWESHFQVSEWGLRYVNKEKWTWKKNLWQLRCQHRWGCSNLTMIKLPVIGAFGSWLRIYGSWQIILVSLWLLIQCLQIDERIYDIISYWEGIIK